MWGFLIIGVVLLAAFVVLQTRVANPLLPMRVVLDRNRGGSYLAGFLLSVGMFGIFLFLTFYLQQNLRFSPIESGVAYLPMVAMLMIAATSATSLLLPKFGPRPLVPLGLLVAAAGMWWFSGIDTSSTYLDGVLFPLMTFGIGIGLAMAPSISVATLGVDTRDAGVASALVNTMQQVGGSIGIALLSTLAANAATSFVTSSVASGKQPSPQLAAEAAIHSYTTAFTASAVIYLAGAIICGLLLRSGAPSFDEEAASVVPG